MNKYVIGIDPGSTKGHGVATYEDGKLIDLSMMTLFQLMEHINHLGDIPDVHIEDMMGKKGNWHTGSQGQKSAAKTGEHLGYCKWAQVEVEREGGRADAAFNARPRCPRALLQGSGYARAPLQGY